MERIEAQRAAHEARSADQATQIAETLAKTVLRFDVKAGPTGSLFGSVTTTEIADEIWRTRKIRVDRRKIGVDHIKRIGRYTVPIDVYEGVTAELKLLVVPEGGELPPEEELAAMEAAEAAAAAEAAGASEAAAAATEEAVEVYEAEPEPELEAELEPRPSPMRRRSTSRSRTKRSSSPPPRSRRTARRSSQSRVRSCELRTACDCTT